ncbi:MAG: chloramphenicol acetyltransferase CAT, partial [Clostridiales bacterium]|nr:chloramphenicol acetyltransferase CAT [Clostridiales bacterium]
MKSQFFTYDQATWPRAQHFHYYAKMFPVHISVNRKIDVTELLPALEKKGYRQDCVFYYMVTRAINNQGELSVAYKDGQIGWWNYLNPAYP